MTGQNVITLIEKEIKKDKNTVTMPRGAWELIKTILMSLSFKVQ